MPSGLIEQQNGMCARRDVEGDLLEVNAHRLAVAAGHDDAGGFTFGGTDRAEQPRLGASLILGCRDRNCVVSRKSVSGRVDSGGGPCYTKTQAIHNVFKYHHST